MYSFVRTACLGLAATLMLTATAQASTWRTTYINAGGRETTAIVQIQGSTGSYASYDRWGNFVGSGRLFGVQFENFGGQPLLRGTWQFDNGVTGQFTWRMDQQLRSFRGSWIGPGANGPWDGYYTGGSGQLGNNGPFVGSP